MPRQTTIFLLLASALALSALTLEQNFIFDLTGGCSVSFTYVIPNRSAGVLAGVHKTLGARQDPPVAGGVEDEAAVRAQFANLPGVAVDSYFLFKRPDARRVQFTVSAKDARAAIASGAFGDYRLQPSAKVLGDLEFDALLPSPAHPWTEAEKTRARAISQDLDGFKIILRVIAPTEILESTGQREAFNQTVWRFTEEDLLNDHYPAIHARW